MQQGSIVGLSREVGKANEITLFQHNISLRRNTPYVVRDIEEQEFQSPKRVTTAILLEEFPWMWLDSAYFMELQPPMKISLEKLLPEIIKNH